MMTPPVRTLPRPLAIAATLGVATLTLLGVGYALAPTPWAWDAAILGAARRAGGSPLARAATDVTALGGGTVLTLVVLGAAGLLLAQRLWLTALLLAATSWTGGRTVALAKDLAARARPDMVEHLVPVSSASFPSGHAANSAVVYLTLAALAAQGVRTPASRAWLFACAFALTLLIGASRVHLGVHWPSDVLAGWSFGALWALGWWWIGLRLRVTIGGER